MSQRETLCAARDGIIVLLVAAPAPLLPATRATLKEPLQVFRND